MVVTFTAHMLACVWFVIGAGALEKQLAGGVAPDEVKAWVSSSINITEMEPEEQYWVSFYWAWTTMTTLG